MTTALRAGTSNDGYLQVNTTDVVKITNSRVDILSTTSPSLTLNKAADANDAYLVGFSGGLNRWAMYLGASGASDFVINRFNDAGTFVATALSISRATGATTFAGTVVSSALTINSTTGAGQPLYGAKSGSTRWEVQLGNTAAESTGNLGSNFVVNRYTDAGAFLNTAFYIERSNGNSTWTGHMSPSATNTYDLGNTGGRWRNVYTNDLHLSNGIGDYTIVEGEEDLFLYNNKNGKTYKFALIPVDPSEVPAKAKVA